MTSSASRRYARTRRFGGEDQTMAEPASNGDLLRRLVGIAVVIYPTSALVCHYGFGWSWPFVIWVDLLCAAGFVVFAYRSQRR